MAVSNELIVKLARLDEKSLIAAERYIDFLLYEQERPRRKNKIKFGCWEGQLKYISDHFDDSLEL